MYIENNNLCAEFVDESYYYIVFPYGMGDTLYALSFAEAFRKKENISKRLCFIIKKAHKGIAGWFLKDDDEVIVSDDLVKSLNEFSISNGVWKLGNYLYAHFKKDPSGNLYKEYFDIGANMLDKYRSLVFDLPDDTETAVPVIPDASYDLIEKYGIDKNTIILMPYARSQNWLPEGFWEALVRLFDRNGYKVLTNVVQGEPQIEGTTAMSESVEETAGLCKAALAVIALRSGLCDILALIDTPMFVIYTDRHSYESWNLSCVKDDGCIANLLCDVPDKMSETAVAIAECFIRPEYKRSKPDRPLISIIMPVHNNEIYFPKAVRSVLDQKFDDWELIIVEGRSTDNTAAIADELAKQDNRIRTVHYDEWIYESINYGVSISVGKYYMVLNSDDRLAENALTVISDYLIRYNVDMFMIKVGTVVCDKDQNGISDDIAESEQIMPEEMVITDADEFRNKWVTFLSSGLLNDQLNVYKKDRIKDYRYRNDVYGADYLYNLEVLPAIRSAAYYPKCLYYFQVYRGVEGMNTSVGKYYEYTHEMFNEFYFRGLNLFVNGNCLTGDALYFLKKRRVMEFIVTELEAYIADNCPLSLDERLQAIQRDAEDIKHIIRDDVINADIDPAVAVMSKRLSDKYGEKS